jgi:hypothetical protein
LARAFLSGAMADRHVVVRLPTVGTVLGGILRDHPGAIVRTVMVPSNDPSEVRFRAAVAGLPTAAFDRLRLEWHVQYGTVPRPLDGVPDGLQMTLAMDRIAQPEMARLLQLEPRLSVLGNVAAGTWVEQWLAVPPGEALRVSQLVQDHLPAVPGLQVHAAQPRGDDLAAWQELRSAPGRPLQAGTPSVRNG